MKRIVKNNRIYLGKRGENEANCWLFPVADWEQEHGKGTVALMVKRPEEETYYPVPLERDGDCVVWCVTSADTAIAGHGEAELTYKVGEKIAKSKIFITTIADSMTGTEGEPPAPPTDEFVNHLIEISESVAQNATLASESAKNAEQSKTAVEETEKRINIKAEEIGKAVTDAQQSAQKAEESIKHSPKIIDDFWNVWNPELQKYENTGINARGQNGDSAYEIAVENGFKGTVEEWLNSLKGKDGEGIVPPELTEQVEKNKNDILSKLDKQQGEENNRKIPIVDKNGYLEIQNIGEIETNNNYNYAEESKIGAFYDVKEGFNLEIGGIKVGDNFETSARMRTKDLKPFDVKDYRHGFKVFLNNIQTHEKMGMYFVLYNEKKEYIEDTETWKVGERHTIYPSTPRTLAKFFRIVFFRQNPNEKIPVNFVNSNLKIINLNSKKDFDAEHNKIEKILNTKKDKYLNTVCSKELELGTLIAGEPKESVFRIRTKEFMPVDVVGKYFVTALTDGWKIDVCMYNSQKSHIDDAFYFQEGEQFELRQETSYVKFLIAPVKDNLPTNEDLKSVVACISPLEETQDSSNYLKMDLMTFNVGEYGYGTPPYGIKDSQYEEKLSNYKRFFGKNNCDIICLQELNPFLDQSNSKPTNENLYNFLYPYNYSDEKLGSRQVFSKIPIIFKEKFSIKERNALGIKIKASGKEVYVANVHLSPGIDTASEEKRKKELEAIIKHVSVNKYFIIAGDFNTQTLQDVVNLKTLAKPYRLANRSYFGDISTYHGQDANIGAIDNVITSMNIIINNVEVIDNYNDLSSDHLPLKVSLSIY